MITTFLIISFVDIILGQTVGDTSWDRIDTTWNAIAFDGFYSVPITESSAIKDKWIQIMNCTTNGSPGIVYSDGGDLSSLPFYNADGKIAGMILGMSDPGPSSETAEQPFVEYTLPNGTIFWGVEANFRDPKQICTAGTSGDIKVGDRLWFANGNHKSYYEAPLNQSATQLNEDGWELGACFVTMGVHYWRYLSVDMNCNAMYPIFLLYNGHKLNAWGIAMAHDDRPDLTSFRWEHPGGSELEFFFQTGEEPTCLPNQGTLSTQHIFMTNPAFDFC